MKDKQNPKEVRDREMEQRCLEAHEEGRARPLREFIDEVKASIDNTKQV